MDAYSHVVQYVRYLAVLLLALYVNIINVFVVQNVALSLANVVQNAALSLANVV